MAAVSTPFERRPWSSDEYLRASEAGIFRSEERLELLEGEIVRPMSPQGLRHVQTVTRIVRRLMQVVGPGRDVMSQQTTLMSETSMPEPDVAVLRGLVEDLTSLATGADLLLAVEVSETSLEVDRTLKARIYARAGVPEYWIVNLRDRSLEVHRDPLGDGYRVIRRYSDRESFRAGFSEEELLVSDLLTKV